MSELLLPTVWLIPCYTIIGALLTIPWSPGIIRRTGPRPAGYINLLMTLTAFLHGLFALPAAWNKPAQEIVIPWLKVAGLELSIPLEISPITIGAILVVTGLNLLGQTYAIGYMEMDWGWARFYSLLALFEAGMCSLVLCNSLFFSYMILEVLTLGTYMLVGLWFSQPLVVTGARDAFLTKRVGDLILLMGVLALLPIAGTWNFSELAEWAKTAEIPPTTAALLGLGLIAGPMGKCAQFPLHLWLDEAMEGPVPSTILRNSVVVATGAWILVKLQPVLALSPLVMSFAVFIGAVTALGATLIAIAQIDVKRALSYLVSAYMGLVFIAVGTGQAETARLLLLTYALPMALLVMSTGTIVWNNISQDLTQLGGLWRKRPIAGLSLIVGAFGLLAVPPFGCFWSLLKLADRLWETQTWLFVVLLAINALAAFSLTRVFGLIFAGQPKQMAVRSPEVLWPMAFPMVFLASFVFHLPLLLLQWQLLPNWETLNITVATLLVISSAIGFGAGSFIYLNDAWPKPVELAWKPLQDLFAYDFYTPKLYRISIVFVVGLISTIVNLFDRYLVDGMVNLVGLATVFSGQTLKYNVSGKSQFYALTILVGVVLLVVFLCWPLLIRLELAIGS
ncbi:MAG TPA: NAD(P)H-quinone oxidoreductase subunit F [Leptolyngbyaceae cyanobacterium]|nr:NAD(P)H-quinone oxidoreductase subunit F [Kamptonema sp.]